MQEAAKKLAENAWGLLLARFVTPLLLAIALWLGSQYLARLDEAFDVMAERLNRLDESLAATNRQIAAIDAAREVQLEADDGDLNDIAREMLSLRNRVDTAVTQISAVTAKVEILLSNRDVRDSILGADP